VRSEEIDLEIEILKGGNWNLRFPRRKKEIVKRDL